MKRPAIAAVATGAAAVLVAASIVGVIAYRSVTTAVPNPTPAVLTSTQVADYKRVLEGWPYPFAPGDAVPTSPPALSGTSPTPDSDRTFVSFFYQCSWINSLLHGPQSRRDDALSSLQAWNDLPASVSSASNADGGWKSTVLDPAVAGNLKPMTGYYQSCTTYLDTRTTPSRGLIVDRALPTTATPSPAASASSANSVGSCPIAPAVDSGPATGARGDVTLDASGVPVAYTVAANDAYYEIAERFGIADACLFPLNCVRRDRSDPTALFIGDTINLDWHTVTSVGNSNGKVYNNKAFCFTADPPYPPQR